MDLFQSFELDSSNIKYSGTGFYQRKIASSELGSKDLPLNIHLDTDTDWAVVAPSAAGVVVALIVAWLTVRVQSNQIKANLSNFRHQWMSELRNCASEYLQTLFAVAIRRQQVQGYIEGPDFRSDQEKIAVLTCKFEMLLSRDDEKTKRLFDLDLDLIDDLYSLKFGEDKSHLIDKLNELKDMLRNELEEAWEDIQVDVGRKARRSDSKISRVYKKLCGMLSRS